MGAFLEAIMAFSGKAQKNLDEFVREVCFQLFFEVTMRTPVKTGRTRGNWYLSPKGQLYGWYDPERMSPDGTGNLQETRDALATVNAGGVVRIVNHTPYVIELEYGYSKQAPSGMARLAVLEFQPVVNVALGRIGNAR